MTTKELNITKYEFLIYRLLKLKLESGDVFVKESVRFKSFEEDLFDNEKWNASGKLKDFLGCQFN